MTEEACVEEIGGLEDKVEELEPSQDTQALVDMMIRDGVDDGIEDENDVSYTMEESSDEDDVVGGDDSYFVKEVRDIDDNQRVTSVVTDYEVNDTIFTEADIEEWRKKRRKVTVQTQRWILSMYGQARRSVSRNTTSIRTIHYP